MSIQTFLACEFLRRYTTHDSQEQIELAQMFFHAFGLTSGWSQRPPRLQFVVELFAYCSLSVFRRLLTRSVIWLRFPFHRERQAIGRQQYFPAFIAGALHLLVMPSVHFGEVARMVTKSLSEPDNTAPEPIGLALPVCAAASIAVITLAPTTHVRPGAGQPLKLDSAAFAFQRFYHLFLSTPDCSAWTLGCFSRSRSLLPPATR
jgi:hypothetical protein